MPVYTCEKCAKNFSKKGDYTRHINRKVDCSGKTLDDKITELVEEKVEKLVEDRLSEKVTELVEEKINSTKSENNKDSTGLIMNLVDNLHNILRKDAIIGSDAYHDINKLLFLRFIQPCLSTTLNTLIDSKMYDGVEDFDESILNYLKDLNELVKLDDHGFIEAIYKIWDCLSVHNFTKDIFESGKTFKSKAKTLRTCLQKIVKTIKDNHFDDLDNDIKGLIYEHFLNGYADKGGKEFGQFFTPRNLINLIMKLNAEVFEDFHSKDLSNVYDPCMGTAGFLTEAYKYLKNSRIQGDPEVKEENKTDMKENKTEEEKSGINLHGTELEPKTYASGLMNILLTTGQIHHMECKNSLNNNLLKEYDWIVTNPPFGVKGIKYSELLEFPEFEVKQEAMIRGQKSKKVKKISYEMEDLYPIKTNDASALFLQHCIKKLRNDGVCNIVLPDGQLMNSKTFIKLRKYLVEECDLKAVLSIPNGTFKHAGVATLVLFFSKQEETCTSEVKFYQAMNECKDYKLLCSVDYDTLSENNFVLNYKTYMPKEERKSKGKTEMKTLGELCAMLPTTKHCTNIGLTEGNYRFYNSSENDKLYLNNYEIEDECVIVGNGGNININIDNKFTASKHVTVLKLDKNIVLTKYVYYYLISNKNLLEEISKGATIKWINKENLSNIQIPVPSLEVQEEIIKDCEVIEESKKLSLQQIENIKKIIEIYNRTQIKTLFNVVNDEKDDNRNDNQEQKTDSNETNAEIKTFGELVRYLHKRGNYKSADSKEYSEENKYRFYTCAEEVKYINECLYSDNLYLIINRNGNANVRIDNEFTAEKDHIYICETDNETLTKYLYYYLKTNLDIIEIDMIGTGIKGTSKEKLNAIKIPVPSTETQEKIIRELELFYKQIEQTQKNVNTYENNIKLIINYYV